MQREQLIKEIQQFGLSQFQDEILSVARPCLGITTSKATAPIPPSQSKIGGAPELPSDVSWPTSENGTPMLFLARIAGADLRRIHPHLADRHLLFFADWEYNTGGCILAIPTDIPVVSAEAPERPTDTTQRLIECVAHITDTLSLPAEHDEFENWRYSKELLSFGARSKEIWGGSYTITVTPLGELVEQFCGPNDAAYPHRVFGYPLFTQGHPAEVAEQRFKSHFINTGEPKEEFVRSASQWLSVLSLGTDETAELFFGDTGTCGFLVTDKALAAGVFEDSEFYQDNC